MFLHVFVVNFIVGNYLRIEQTQRVLKGEQCETADKGPYGLLMEDTTAGAV